ncbi:hypothetical protein [Rhizobium sp. BG4]|uniref:hypothetical protein n=1 Tax=Rhizobium sp. BG4 TaxID=2613770 RepID=UPI00193DDDB3|nr:hypothetical protein [Rhizobium sp. BG4]QRM45811.1 hypothetical protein F2982_20510 [Rhizobium sp. BG4]
MFDERAFGRFIRRVKSLWEVIFRDRRTASEAERIVIPLYAPQAYPDGFPFGKPRPSDEELERENRENGSS